MSASRNPDGPGVGTEFHSKVDRDEPMQTSGHKPGKMVGNDAVPEFHAEALPAGSAPPSRTFKPNTSAASNSPADPTSTSTSKLVDDVLADGESTKAPSNVAPASSSTPSASTAPTANLPELKQGDAISADKSTRPGTNEAFGVAQSATPASTSSVALSTDEEDNILSATDIARPGASDADPLEATKTLSDPSLSSNVKGTLDQLSEAAPITQPIVPQSIAEKLPTASQAADAVKYAAASIVSGVQNLALGANDAVAKNSSSSSPEDSSARNIDDLRIPGEYQSRSTEAEDRTAVQSSLQSAQETLPSTEDVMQSVQSAQNALPSSDEVESSLQTVSNKIPTTEDAKNTLQSTQNTLPSPQDALQSAKRSLPDAEAVKSNIPSAKTVKNSLPDLDSVKQSLPSTDAVSKQASTVGSSISEQAQEATTSVQNQAHQAVNYVKEQLPGQQNEQTPKPVTELIEDHHTTAYSSTSQLDGNISPQGSGVPQVVADSQRLALASPEASANPEVVQDKMDVERELREVVPQQPAVQEREEVEHTSSPRPSASGDDHSSVSNMNTASLSSDVTIPRVLRSEPPSDADLQPGIRFVGVREVSTSEDALPEPGMVVKTVSHITELRTADVSVGVKKDTVEGRV